MISKKILIIKFSALGDMVLSTIIPHAIKRRYPDIEIHYLTSRANTALLENCPDVDRIITYNGNFFECIRIIWQERYDIVFCLNFTLRCYLYTFLALSKKIVFKSFKGTSWVEKYFNTAQKVFKDLELPENLYLSNTDIKILNSVKERLKAYKRPFIVINPGKYHGNARQGRLWNIKNWEDLSEKLLSEYGGTVFVNGNSSERDYHFDLKRENSVVLSGLLNIKEACALLSLADLVISGDSGPVHIASAYNVKTISLLGSTSPEKIKPYGANGFFIAPETECKYCWKKKCKLLKDKYAYAPCIESITVEKVMNKIKSCDLLTDMQKCRN